MLEIGAKVFHRRRHITFQLTEVGVPTYPAPNGRAAAETNTAATFTFDLDWIALGSKRTCVRALKSLTDSET